VTGSRRTVVLASRNEAKLVELRRILAAAGLDVELVGLPPGEEVAETGATFADNALLKARAATALTGLPAIADDSGLEVDALNGMPGVLSARWSGRPAGAADKDEANLDLVLAQVEDVPDGRRGAAFVCVAAVATPDGRQTTASGVLRGTLLRARRGTGGFGYDPIFLPTGSDRTTAEMTPGEKDEISHRGRALRALAEELPAVLAVGDADATAARGRPA
jgi:XTP/dITP diphosphohydrolase